MEPMNDRESKVSVERITLYQQCNDELRFFKQQQWKVTYYCLLLLTAITFIDKNFPFVIIPEWYIWVIFGVGVILLLDIQWSLGKHRRIIDEIKEDFDEKTKQYLKANDDRLSYKIWKPISRYPYIAVFVLVLFIACWIVRDMIDDQNVPYNAKRLEWRFNKVDADGDGKISLKEHMIHARKRARNNFKLMDANNDGFLSKVEFNKGMTKTRKRNERKAKELSTGAKK